MKRDATFLYVFTTIFGCCSAKAFLTSPSQTAATHSAAQQVGSISPEFGGYPEVAGVRYMPGGGIFQPRDAENLNERPVYDPGDGDELLRTLNAEIAASGTELGTQPEEPDYADTVFNELEGASKYDMLRELEEELHEEQDIDPTIDTLPLIYVEQASPDDVLYTSPGGMEKRSRYYRRYPWKRHNRHRSNYEPELRYACTPSKEDVFKLLLDLHENRKGNHHKTVQFCNRKRPAKAIFTNIRFLG